MKLPLETFVNVRVMCLRIVELEVRLDGFALGVYASFGTADSILPTADISAVASAQSIN
jgi:hypothetical protein